MSQSILLGYWGIRGRGQVLRLLLVYTGLEWAQRKYLSQEEWKGIGKDKTSLGIPFPNLPYLIHLELKLSESKAIMNYIINISGKKELFGKNLQDEAIVGTLVSVFTQIMARLIELNFDVQNFDNKKTEVQMFVQSKLQIFEDILKGKDFALGYLTLADFLIAQTSYYIENICPELFSRYTSLKTVRSSFENVEQIKAYYSQQNAVKSPFLPPIGKVQF